MTPTRVKRLLLILLSALVLTIAGPVGWAQAAAGQVRLCVPSISQSSIYVAFTNGGRAWVAPGRCVGEGTSLYPSMEPNAFQVWSGQRFEYWKGSSAIHFYDTDTGTGHWRHTHPGSTFPSGAVSTSYVKRIL